jgi:hypothetical protein
MDRVGDFEGVHVLLALHNNPKLILKGKMICKKSQNQLKVTRDCCFCSYVRLHFKIWFSEIIHRKYIQNLQNHFTITKGDLCTSVLLHFKFEFLDITRLNYILLKQFLLSLPKQALPPCL